MSKASAAASNEAYEIVQGAIDSVLEGIRAGEVTEDDLSDRIHEEVDNAHHHKGATMPVPNLDAMPESELMTFWGRYHRPKRADAKALVGKRKGYVSLTEWLACYAVNKACAMGCRIKGKIPAAVAYEDACEMIYRRLPEDLRW